MSTQPDSTPQATAEAPDKGVGSDALLGDCVTVCGCIYRNDVLVRRCDAFLYDDRDERGFRWEGGRGWVDKQGNSKYA